MTAETAVVLPVLLVVLGLCVWALASVSAQLRCTDAAAVAARAAARGDPAFAVVAAAARVAPQGARVEVSQDGDSVRVVVRATVRPVGGAPGVAVSGQAVARREDAP